MLEIYDCTLREGEQAAGASFSLDDRIKIFELLDKFGVNFVELGWPVVSDEILESFKICKQKRKQAKIVAFGSTSINSDVTQDKNLNSLIKSEADYACIFGKTSKDHVILQLGITPEENIKRISDSILFLKKNQLSVFYDAEHFFDGYKLDPKYALETLVTASNAGAERLILCDTNGGLKTGEAKKIVNETKKYLDSLGIFTSLGVHFHDDRSMALENTFSCLDNIIQVQGTFLGAGERVGNLAISTFVSRYTLEGGKLNVRLNELKDFAEEIARLTGFNLSGHFPFIGEYAFAHKGGVHINAQEKGANYEHANPRDFGNRQIILLNSLGGKSGVLSVAKQFKYELDKNSPEVKSKIEELNNELRLLEQAGYKLGALEAEQYLLIEKYFGNLREFIKLESWNVTTGKEDNKVRSTFYGKFNLDGQIVEETSTVLGGPIDAAYKTFKKVLKPKYPRIAELKILDFHEELARRKEEESSVRTEMIFKNSNEFQTVGVDSNQIQSGLEALAKGCNYHLNNLYIK